MIYVLTFLIGMGVGYGIAGVQYTKAVKNVLRKTIKDVIKEEVAYEKERSI